jgi:hypothetical protein
LVWASFRFLVSTAFTTVLGTGLLAAIDTKGIEGPANNVVSDTRKVPNPPATDEDYIVLLQVMADTRNVGRDLLTIGETNSRNLAKGGVRLLRSHGFDLQTNSPLLRTVAQHSRLTFTLGLLAAFANKLVNSWHSEFPAGLVFDT